MTNAIGVVLGVVLGFIILIALALLLSAPLSFVVMLALGVAHSWNEIIPPLGFLETWALVWALRIAVIPTKKVQA